MDPVAIDTRSIAGSAALISDPTRGRLLRLLLAQPDGRSTVTRLADELGLRQPTVTHHAKALAEAGILARAPEGRQVWYSIAADRLDLVSDLLTTDIPALPEDSVFDRIVDDLSLRFTGTFGRETVERCVTECRRLLTSTATTTRLASRTASFATERLSAAASERSPAEGMPEVLFVCVRNAGRSQMAAALLRRLAGDRIHVRTAGSQPAARVSPAIVDALEELGVPIGDEFPKPLTDDVVRAADVVVTLGCGDACPVYAGTRYLDWDLPDPVGRTSDEVRAIRDALDERVRGLLVSLLPRTS